MPTSLFLPVLRQKQDLPILKVLESCPQRISSKIVKMSFSCGGLCGLKHLGGNTSQEEICVFHVVQIEIYLTVTDMEFKPRIRK